MSKFAHAPARSSQRRRTWCGPYAAAVVLGLDYDTAYDLCLQANPSRQRITGLSKEALRRVLWAAGRKCFWSGFMAEQPTLAQWYKTRPDKQATYIVNVTGHYVVVRGTRIIDNQQPVWQAFADRRKHKRSRVVDVMQFD